MVSREIDIRERAEAAEARRDSATSVREDRTSVRVAEVLSSKVEGGISLERAREVSAISMRVWSMDTWN